MHARGAKEPARPILTSCLPARPSPIRSGGHCLELSLDRLFAGPPAPPAGGGPAGAAAGGKGGGNVLSFRGWTLDMLQVSAAAMKYGYIVSNSHLLPCTPHCPHPHSPSPPAQAACVLAGCDFLPSIKGVSFRTAFGFVSRRRSLAGALRSIRLEKRFQLLATQVWVRWQGVTAAAVHAWQGRGGRAPE